VRRIAAGFKSNWAASMGARRLPNNGIQRTLFARPAVPALPIHEWFIAGGAIYRAPRRP